MRWLFAVRVSDALLLRSCAVSFVLHFGVRCDGGRVCQGIGVHGFVDICLRFLFSMCVNVTSRIATFFSMGLRFF